MLGKWAAMQLSGAVLKHVLCSQLSKETTSAANGQWKWAQLFLLLPKYFVLTPEATYISA